MGIHQSNSGHVRLTSSRITRTRFTRKPLNKEGYFQSQTVPGFWKYTTKPIQFVLVVDDFGIKYLKQEDLDHLVRLLEKHYDVAVDLDGRECVKIELDWDYENKRVHL